MDSCVCMAESFCYLPDTVTTLFVNWPYPNTKAKVKKVGVMMTTEPPLLL